MLIVAFFFVLLLAGPGWSVGPDIFLRASRDSGVPAELLLAVSHVESSFNPHALNLAGRSFLPSSRHDAERVLSRSGDNVDIGLMQVNYEFWGKKLGLSKVDLLDPALNVLVGARILGHYVERSQDWWEGVGFYHSPRPERQLVYIRRVWRSYRRIVSRMRS